MANVAAKAKATWANPAFNGPALPGPLASCPFFKAGVATSPPPVGLLVTDPAARCLPVTRLVANRPSLAAPSVTDTTATGPLVRGRSTPSSLTPGAQVVAAPTTDRIPPRHSRWCV
jgi:hypothetical protein